MHSAHHIYLLFVAQYFRKEIACVTGCRCHTQLKTVWFVCLPDDNVLDRKWLFIIYTSTQPCIYSLFFQGYRLSTRESRFERFATETDSTESELPPHPRESILSFIPFPPHSSTQKFGQQQRDKAFCRWNLSQRRKLWISLDYGNRHRWVRIFDQNNPESQEKWNMFEKLTCIQFVQ